MSTIKERRDVFWKSKAKGFAKQRDAEAHRRREAEIKASDAMGGRKAIVKQFRKARRWTRAWKGIAKHLDIKITVAQQRWEEIYQKKYDRIAALETALRNLVDKLDAVAPEISKLSTLAWAHGNRYTGPNYGEELKVARKVLDHE